MRKRVFKERLAKAFMVFSVGTIVFILGLIILTIVFKGISSLSWNMIFQTPKGGYYLGKEGGILNAIIGSLYLAIGSTFLAALFGIPVAIYLNVYQKKQSFFCHCIRACFDILWGVPSIVYGAFGFMVMVFLGLRASLLAGILVITLVIFPGFVRALDEFLQMIPKGLYEASYSLGATRLQTAIKVVLKQSVTGIITALLIAFGRAIGDAAAVLFSAGYSDHVPTSLFQAVATLPLSIFFQLSTPFPQVQARAYASAIILTLIILIISIASRIFIRRWKRFKIE